MEHAGFTTGIHTEASGNALAILTAQDSEAVVTFFLLRTGGASWGVYGH